MASSEVSFGIIPVRRVPLENGNLSWEILVVEHRKGHWTFPKGHPNPDETAEDTAIRELHEETGLVFVRYLSYQSFQEKYIIDNPDAQIEKTAIYFLAEVRGDVKLQEEELSSHIWVAIAECESHLTFAETKSLCHRALSTIHYIKR